MGTTSNYNGLFNKAIYKQITHCVMYNLIAKTKKNTKKLCLPVDIECELFNQLITPILLYGSEIWGFYQTENIEIFHRSFLKSLLKLPKGTANCMINGELERFELASTIEKRMVNFWARVRQGKASKLSNIMYKLLRQLRDHTDYKSKWITKVKNILVKCRNARYLPLSRFPNV